MLNISIGILYSTNILIRKKARPNILNGKLLSYEIWFHTKLDNCFPSCVTKRAASNSSDHIHPGIHWFFVTMFIMFVDERKSNPSS